MIPEVGEEIAEGPAWVVRECGGVDEGDCLLEVGGLVGFFGWETDWARDLRIQGERWQKMWSILRWARFLWIGRWSGRERGGGGAQLGMDGC